MKHLKIYCFTILTICWFGFPLISIAQKTKVDYNILSDSTIIQFNDSLAVLINQADSVTHTFQLKADSLSGVFEQQLIRIEGTQRLVQGQLDSLHQLKLPTEKLTRKLDSLQSVKQTTLTSLTTEIESLKVRAMQTLQEINLPPQLQEPMQKLQASIKEYALPDIDLSVKELPDFELKKLGSLKLPNLTDQISLDPNLKDFASSLNKVQGFAGQAGTYVQDVQNLVQGNLDEVRSLDKVFENKVAGMEGLDQLTEGKAVFAEYSQIDSAWVKEQAKALVQEQVTLLAQNHFTGKQEILQQAMDKMAKLKTRYSEVQSMAELPKWLPNPLKGKPLIERLLPGISFQIQKSDNFLLDVNPYLMYRIIPRFSAGVGWNHRFAFDGWQIAKDDEVYGPRVLLELKWVKGINFRLLPELMYTAIPSKLASSLGVDPSARQWVPSLFGGIKKEFRVYKAIMGNTEILYNLYDQDGKSPYGDRLSIRFGFEFPMRSKPKSN